MLHFGPALTLGEKCKLFVGRQQTKVSMRVSYLDHLDNFRFYTRTSKQKIVR